MSLGIFYEETEKRIINDLVLYLIRDKPIDEIKILNVYVSKDKKISEHATITNISIGEDIKDFINEIPVYVESLKKYKYDIVNCRFSLRKFMSDIITLTKFIEFVSSVMEINGYFMGFLLDMKRLNSIFAEMTHIQRGPYKIEYGNYDSNLNRYNIIINDEQITILNSELLESICRDVGLYHVDNIILESLYKNSINDVILNVYEKQFGFMNYVFLYKKKMYY